jgi:hypothetical protein
LRLGLHWVRRRLELLVREWPRLTLHVVRISHLAVRETQPR